MTALRANGEPLWLHDHRFGAPYSWADGPLVSRSGYELDGAAPPASDPLLSDVSFNNHSRNDGMHISPYDNGKVQVGLDGLEVRLLQGIDRQQFANVLSRATRATTGLPVPQPGETVDADWEEMMRGGLQSALETQTIVFEVWGASRALTHQLVRSRKAAFHQQSQRATWYGDRPEARMPESVWRASSLVRAAWLQAVQAAWTAYELACNSGISYQDARYILPESTTSYIMCEYTVREFINVYAYRGCSMFLWEMVGVMRAMRAALLEQSPWMERYVKVSCEKGTDCATCGGSGYLWEDGYPGRVDLTEVAGWDKGGAIPSDVQLCPTCTGLGSPDRKCTFQGWENVEGQCAFPHARQSNRVFLPSPKYRIGDK